MPSNVAVAENFQLLGHDLLLDHHRHPSSPHQPLDLDRLEDAPGEHDVHDPS